MITSRGISERPHRLDQTPVKSLHTRSSGQGMFFQLRHYTSELEKQPMFDDYGNGEDSQNGHFASWRHTARRQSNAMTSTTRLTIVLAVTSVICNIILSWLLYRSNSHHSETLTPYARLERNIPSRFDYSTKFGLGTDSEVERSVAWESLDTSAGEVALDKVEAETKGLPASTPFWWDKSRSLYVINGHHNIHCLRKLRRSIVLSHYNMSQVDQYPHLVHCMDHLLQNILCEADDTPLYTIPRPHSTTGTNQPRMCRSWDKLQSWALSQTSCFSFINETQGVDDALQRFRYCPTDSPAGRRYDHAMRQHFGLKEEWSGRPRMDIETVPRYWEGFGEGAR